MCRIQAKNFTDCCFCCWHKYIFKIKSTGKQKKFFFHVCSVCGYNFTYAHIEKKRKKDKFDFNEFDIKLNYIRVNIKDKFSQQNNEL